jgi:hypothetical protein
LGDWAWRWLHGDVGQPHFRGTEHPIIVGIDIDKPAERRSHHGVGVGRGDHVLLMLGTDFPASGGILGGAVNWIKKFGPFSEEDKNKILMKNAERFLNLKKTD